MTPRPAFVVALAAAVVGFDASAAFAHAMRMTVSVGAAEIVVKTSYSGDDHDGGDVTVTISGLDKRVVATGKIGPDGKWTAPKPPAGSYTVVASDEFGHRAEQTVEIGADVDKTEWKANEPPVSSGLGIAVGIGAIGLATLVGYWLLSRKKPSLR